MSSKAVLRAEFSKGVLRGDPPPPPGFRQMISDYLTVFWAQKFARGAGWYLDQRSDKFSAILQLCLPNHVSKNDAHVRFEGLLRD